MSTPDILCVGSVLWDVIGRSPGPMRVGSDTPGRIVRRPGGVAMNIATAARRFGLTPALLTAVGRDAEGDQIIAEANRAGLVTDHAYRPRHLPTDRCMVVEASNGMIATIADTRSLEAAGARILRPARNGPLGRPGKPWSGLLALDGNLTAELLMEIGEDPLFAAADLRVASASSGKAGRIQPFLRVENATIYVNREEAGLLCGGTFETSLEAAEEMLDRGARRVLVTDGGRAAADGAAADGFTTMRPPEAPATPASLVTGAGDVFMAAHIAAEARGAARRDAMSRALDAAAAHLRRDVG